MPYHIEHHAWPTVPFYRLGEAHRLLVEGMANVDLFDEGEIDTELAGSGKRGYVSFNFAFLHKNFFDQKDHRGYGETKCTHSHARRCW
mmetsp:Transcript_11021/g.19236  ORF Transcript_11021/g.19236 Transcript_11021/m.19236 type:complete len:88 (+) Transcript_11021:177-440(+)